MNEVTVSTLPHPISMFFIGFMLFGAIYLYFEFKKLLYEYKNVISQLDELKRTIQNSEIRYETRINEISKKIDSRVDKAILNLRNKPNISAD